jgi:hypothetical protein
MKQEATLSTERDIALQVSRYVGHRISAQLPAQRCRFKVVLTNPT